VGPFASVERVSKREVGLLSADGWSFPSVDLGKNLLLSLTSHSIACTYVHLPALPSVLPRASLVLLGTSALLSNGALYARAGTASVALLANARAVPVVVCCETYKFGEKVQLDAVVANEMGETRELLKTGTNHPLKETVAGELPQAMQLINLLYDLTPPELVSAVCTEVSPVAATLLPLSLPFSVFS
jgi:translation initiation factor eIF-2B subunit delta